MTAPTRAKVITLRDIREAAPVESEEDRRVMQTIEQNDPTGESTRYFDSFPSEENFVNVDEPKGVEDDLFEFTNSICNLHFEMQVADVDLDTQVAPSMPANVYDGSRNGVTSNADAFAANAGKLFHRFAKTKKGKESNSKLDGIASDIETDSGGRFAKRMKSETLESLQEFKSLMSSNKKFAISYVRSSFFFVILPSTILAGVLFYFLGNPNADDDLEFNFYGSNINPTAAPIMIADNVTREEDIFATDLLDEKCTIQINGEGPTVSWWILFLGVRQVVTLGLARAAQFLVLTYALKVASCFGLPPMARLFLLQSKGLPFILILWSMIDFAMLFGDRDFSRHWAYYQDYIELFNDCNPAGNVTTDKRYRSVLIFMISLGILVAIKRFAIGLFFGKKSYVRYAEKLSQILKELLLVSKVCKHARLDYWVNAHDLDKNSVLEKWHRAGDDEEESLSVMESPIIGSPIPSLADNSHSVLLARSQSVLSESQNVNIAKLIGEWEDIDLNDRGADNEIDLSSIVQFRASLSVLDSSMPYSPAFGVAKSREQVLDCAQNLYNKLLKKQQVLRGAPANENSGEVLRFHTIALTALKKSGYFDRSQCKELVSLFRPARNGNITLLEFCKSIDNQYKELRKLRASIANEWKMNNATEKIINLGFYGIMFMVFLSVIGIDPVALFGFLASFILGLSFMISGASSDYFRGLMFITVQRPYDIGDRINVSNAQSPADGNGSAGWIVKDVSLYHTTFIYGTTQECATISNGSLSGARIINAARSPRATLNFKMKFGITVSTETVEEFKQELIAYVKLKPREWFDFSAFRLIRIEADLGFVEYKIVLQHRESWQEVGQLLDSLADVQSFAFDLSKEMQMTYKAPCMPVELNMVSSNEQAGVPLMPSTSFFTRR